MIYSVTLEVWPSGCQPGAGPPLAERLTCFENIMACIYVLKSNTTGKRYTGSSHEDNPSHRLGEHNRGKTKSTKSGIPWELLYTERYETYTEARKREIFLKSGQGRKLLDNMLL